MAAVAYVSGAVEAAPAAPTTTSADTPYYGDERSLNDTIQLAAEIDELREENATIAARLAKVHQVLRAIRKLEPKPQRCEGFDDSAADNLVIAYAQTHAAIKARIDLYLQTLPPEVRG
jgi:hypothetical protein